MREVLQALKEKHIGLAKEKCEGLEEAIGGNTDNKALLEDLQNIQGEWTAERKKQGGN